MYLKLEGEHSEVLEQHSEAVEINQLLKSSIASLENALAEARKAHEARHSRDAEELQKQNAKLRDEIHLCAKQLRDIYTGRYQHADCLDNARASGAQARAAHAVRRELESALSEHDQLRRALHEAQLELSQERRLRLRAEGELKGLEYRQARPDWSRAIRADRLPSSPSRLPGAAADPWRGGNP